MVSLLAGSNEEVLETAAKYSAERPGTDQVSMHDSVTGTMLVS